MYQAKTTRKGVVLFCDNMRGEASRALTMQSELTHATERAEMQLYFQPIVDLDNTLATLRRFLSELSDQPNALIFNRAPADDPRPPAGTP